MGVKNADLADLIATTLPQLPKQVFEVAWDNQDYEFTRIYQTERMEVDGGTTIDRRIMLDDNGNASYTRLYGTDSPTVSQHMHKISVPWTQITTNYSWDRLEILRNKNSAVGFIRLLESKRIAGLWSLAKLIEERAWKAPQDASDDLYPYGVPYYLNMVDADSTTGGFVGKTIRYQDGTTGTTCAGLDANTEPRWRSYADLYTSVNADLLKTFRKAISTTRFRPPMIVKDPSDPRVAAKRAYCDLDTNIALQELADKRDDNHSGKDLMGNIKIDDAAQVYINRIPVIWIPQLNGFADPVTSDEVAPIYCVDFSKFIPVVHSGYWMHEDDPMNDRGQHTTFTVFLDGAHNNLCINRRETGFVLHTAITS